MNDLCVLVHIHLTITNKWIECPEDNVDIIIVRNAVIDLKSEQMRNKQNVKYWIKT